MDYRQICGKCAVRFHWLYRITLISMLISVLAGVLVLLKLINWSLITVFIHALILCVLPGIGCGVVLALLTVFDRGYLIAGITTLLGSVLCGIAVVIGIVDSFNTGIYYCIAAILVSMLSTHFELKTHTGAMEDIHEDMHNAWRKMYIWFYLLLGCVMLVFVAVFLWSKTALYILLLLLLVFSDVFHIKRILYLKRTSEILAIEAKG